MTRCRTLQIPGSRAWIQADGWGNFATDSHRPSYAQTSRTSTASGGAALSSILPRSASCAHTTTTQSAWGTTRRAGLEESRLAASQAAEAHRLIGVDRANTQHGAIGRPTTWTACFAGTRRALLAPTNTMKSCWTRQHGCGTCRPRLKGSFGSIRPSRPFSSRWGISAWALLRSPTRMRRGRFTQTSCARTALTPPASRSWCSGEGRTHRLFATPAERHRRCPQPEKTIDTVPLSISILKKKPPSCFASHRVSTCPTERSGPSAAARR